MKPYEIQSAKCGLEIEKQAKMIAHLEQVIADNLFQWECCARGGNKTANGGCSIKVAEQVCRFII